MFAIDKFLNINKENTMSTLDDDLLDNPSARCPVALVLDTSGSMFGAPIDELNVGIQLFIEEVKRDDLAR